MKPEQIDKLLRVVSENDSCDMLFWKEQDYEPKELEFFVLCNDVFFWGTADMEPIETEQDIENLKIAFDDAGEIDGGILYCARRRKLRPQGAMYKYFPRDKWALFDACGPERSTVFSNPVDRPDKE